MPRIDSYTNLAAASIASNDEFVLWDTSASQVANTPASSIAITSNNLSDLASAATARTNLGVLPATMVVPPINRSAAGIYANFPVGGGFTTTTLNVNGNLFFTPIMLAVGRTADRIGIDVTSAGTAATSVHRVGIWQDSDGAPGTLLLDAGTTATDSTGLKEITISQALAANTLYWLGVAQQGAPATLATLRALSSSSQAMIGTASSATPTGIFAQSVTGAFASSPTLSTSSNNSGVPRFVLRFT